MGVFDKGGEKVNKQYVDNVREMFRRKGLGDKYEHPGIYCIKLRGQIVYIGKSQNMLERIASHYVGINTGAAKKYKIIWDVAQELNCPIEFDVLYYAQEMSKDEITEEIGQKEGELIRQHLPPLNTQIPKETNWRTWEVKTLNADEVRRLIVNQ